ncbi:hypothetical protein Tco_0312391, partial [Tanacetum coccineum]
VQKIENEAKTGKSRDRHLLSSLVCDSLHDYETFCFDIEEKSSGSTTSHSDHSLSDYEAFCFDIDHQEEKSNDSITSHCDISLPNYESFCFDINHQEEKSSGGTTFKSDHSLPDYEAFYFEEKSSGSTTSHSDPSLLEYELFYFDLSIDPLPPAKKSDSRHEEFDDELAHIISPPEYDRFYFDIETDPGELTRRLEEIISKDSTKELTSPELNDLCLLLFDCDSIFSEIGFSEIDLLVLFPSGNEDKPVHPASPDYVPGPEHPASPDYVPGPEHPASPDYVPGPEHPPSPIEIPFVPEPEYPEYLVPSEDEAPMEDQPLPADASPVALSPGYVPDSDPEEDSEEEHADYPADGGDGSP